MLSCTVRRAVKAPRCRGGLQYRSPAPATSRGSASRQSGRSLPSSRRRSRWRCFPIPERGERPGGPGPRSRWALLPPLSKPAARPDRRGCRGLRAGGIPHCLRSPIRSAHHPLRCSASRSGYSDQGLLQGNQSRDPSWLLWRGHPPQPPVRCGGGPCALFCWAQCPTQAFRSRARQAALNRPVSASIKAWTGICSTTELRRPLLRKGPRKRSDCSSFSSLPAVPPPTQRPP